MDQRFKFFSVPGVMFVLRDDGWHYAESIARVPRRGEPDQELHFRGPFRDPEAAAEDFASTLGAQFQGRRFDPPDPSSPMLQDTDVSAMMDALNKRMSRVTR